MNKKIVLLTLTAFIATIDFVFVYINYHFSHENLTANIKAEAHRNHVTFRVALDQMYTDLLMVASLYAGSPKIQTLFYNGMRAVEAEGGGAGGAQADMWRKQLFDEVGQSWLAASEEFRIRQLHFHLGPGSISYLRVHSADRFGDNMDNVRFIIVETNATQKRQTGFETGRVYSGLRGVVPMFATDPLSGDKIHTGALEAGTSFSKIIEILDDGLGSAFSVLLTRDHIKNTMWPSAQEKIFSKMELDCRCVVEASSRPGVEDLLRNIPFNANGRPILEIPYMVEMGERTLAATFFPLRDFLGQKKPERPNIGAVLVWQDVTQQIHDLENQQWINVIYALSGFVVLEIMLFIAFGMVTRRLEQTVAVRTRELSELNEQLQHEITVKDRFFSIIAHDLRSPFNTLLGMTRLIEGYVDRYDKQQLRSFAAHISDAGENFFELLQGLLEWSGHQMNKGKLQLADRALGPMADSVISSLSHAAKAKEVEIINTIGAQTIQVDEKMISTVLRNLISNAIKFVHHGGRIELTAHEQPDGLQVCVQDNGVGLNEALLDKLFSVDQKITTTGTDGERGSGLGLPLCKDLIGQHGGHIEAENLAGGGARFCFTLPHRAR